MFTISYRGPFHHSEHPTVSVQSVFWEDHWAPECELIASLSCLERCPPVGSHASWDTRAIEKKLSTFLNGPADRSVELKEGSEPTVHVCSCEDKAKCLT